MGYFVGIDTGKDDWEVLLEAQERLPDDKAKDRFAVTTTKTVKKISNINNIKSTKKSKRK